MHNIRRLIAHHWALSETISPAYGAIVMGSGIVASGLYLNGKYWLSLLVLTVASIAWLTLASLFGYRLLKQPARIKREAQVPAALTGVAGTAVIATNFVNYHLLVLGLVLLLLALLLWLYVLPQVARHLKKPTVGASFLQTVSTQALANLLAALYLATRQEGLLYAAMLLFVLGLIFYLWVIFYFDFHEIFQGHGDHWVIGGALAISSLTIGKITLAVAQTANLSAFVLDFKVLAVFMWAVTMFWLPILLFAEIWNIRIDYDIRRWSTVFPLGMYAACSFSVGKDVLNIPIILEFAHYWVYIGLFAWTVGMIVMLKHDWQILDKG